MTTPLTPERLAELRERLTAYMDCDDMIPEDMVEELLDEVDRLHAENLRMRAVVDAAQELRTHEQAAPQTIDIEALTRMGIGIILKDRLRDALIAMDKATS